MAKNRQQVITVAALVLLAVGIVQGTTLEGSVRSADGEAIQARITILSTAKGVSLDTRDANPDGSFSFEMPSSGLVAVAASASGYGSQEIGLSNGIPSGRLSFTLHPLQEVSGAVTDSRGRNVAGAQVRVRRAGTRRHIRFDHGREAVTDSDGGFTVRVPGGSDRYVVEVTAGGWVPQSSGVIDAGAAGSTGAGSGSTRGILVSLERAGASVSGTVTSPNGSRLSGATVLAGVKVIHPTANDGRFPSKTYRTSTVTDSRGRYEFRGLPPGNLGVVAIKRRVRIQPQWFQSVEGGSYTADFVIPD